MVNSVVAYQPVNMEFAFSDSKNFFSQEFTEFRSEPLKVVKAEVEEVVDHTENIQNLEDSLNHVLGFNPLDAEALRMSQKDESKNDCAICDSVAILTCNKCQKRCCKTCSDGGLCILCIPQLGNDKKRQWLTNAQKSVFAHNGIIESCRLSSLVYFITNPDYEHWSEIAEVLLLTISEWANGKDMLKDVYLRYFMKGLEARYATMPEAVITVLELFVEKSRPFAKFLHDYHMALEASNQFYSIFGKLLQKTKAKVRKGRLKEEHIKFCIICSPPPILPHPVTDKITSIHAMELARQITLMEFEVFAGIRSSELLNVAWTSKHKERDAPNICLYTSRFNKMSNWISSLILKEKSAGDRAVLIEYFLVVQRNLANINNFAGVFEIQAALSSAHISRLENSWALVHPLQLAAFARISTLISAQSNYREYRHMIEAALPGPCIPYLGPWLTDLVMLAESKTWLERPEYEMLNLLKLRKVSQILDKVSMFQQRIFPFEFVNSIITVLRTAIKNSQSGGMEKIFYEASLLLEPRNPNQKQKKQFSREHKLSMPKLDHLRKTALNSSATTVTGKAKKKSFRKII